MIVAKNLEPSRILRLQCHVCHVHNRADRTTLSRPLHRPCHASSSPSLSPSLNCSSSPSVFTHLGLSPFSATLLSIGLGVRFSLLLLGRLCSKSLGPSGNSPRPTGTGDGLCASAREIGSALGSRPGLGAGLGGCRCLPSRISVRRASISPWRSVCRRSESICSRRTCGGQCGTEKVAKIREELRYAPAGSSPI
jgi:hypothetical protein